MSDHEMYEFQKRLDRHYAIMQSILTRLTTLEQAPCSPASPAPAGCTTSGSGATTPPDARNSGPLDTSAAESAGKRSSSDPSAAIRADPAKQYGRCPICGEWGANRERRINGNDQCPKGHSYPSSTAVYHVPTPQPEKAKPAAASAWEEFCAMCGYDPMEWRPLAFDVFNRWVSAREKAAVEAWNRTIFPITATHPSGALSVKVHIEDGNCVVATTDAKPIPKPDAGRAEGVDKDDLLYEAWGVIANACNGNWDLERPEWKEAAARWRDKWHKTLNTPAPKPRRAPEVVAREVWDTMPAGRVNDYIEFGAAAIRADRGEG